MKSMAIAIGKGGTGKTSVAVHVASGLARHGERVLLVDLDSTAHATTWLLGTATELGAGVADVLRAEAVVPGCIHRVEGIPGLSVLPATRSLVGMELALAAEEGGQLILSRALEADSSHWDYVVLDCPPSLGLLTVSAFCSASVVLAPVTCSFLALSGLPVLEESLGRVRRRLGASCALLGCILFGADPRESITAQARDLLRRDAPGLLFDSEIRVSTAAKALPARQKTCWDAGEDARGLADYRALLDEVTFRLAGAGRAVPGGIANG